MEDKWAEKKLVFFIVALFPAPFVYHVLFSQNLENMLLYLAGVVFWALLLGSVSEKRMSFESIVIGVGIFLSIVSSIFFVLIKTNALGGSELVFILLLHIWYGFLVSFMRNLLIKK